jgi:uncharacterized DUF497 family protein
MAITYDHAKRELTLRERGLDFADAGVVLAGPRFDQVDNRYDYGETRIVTVGLLRGRMVILVWTQRGEDTHVISMRKANEKERTRYGEALATSR